MYETQVIRNFLTAEQLSQLQQWVAEWDSSQDIVPAPIGRYIGVSPQVDSMLNSLIDCVPGERLFVRILEATSPGGPHADNGLPTPLPPDYPIPNWGRTFIIPLTTQETHTVIFNQSLPPGVSVGEHIDRLPLLDPRQSVGQVTAQQYLTHTGRPWLDRLSIDCIFPWHAGDMLVFDRSRIHCSDNWTSSGIDVKRGFVIWSEIHL